MSGILGQNGVVALALFASIALAMLALVLAWEGVRRLQKQHSLVTQLRALAKPGGIATGAAGGLLTGLLLGVLLGGSGVFYALGRLERERSQPVQLPHASRSPYMQMLLENDASLTPLERPLFAELDKEPSHGRK